MPEIEKVDILVVDDLPEKLLVYQSILEELGENLVTATSGSEALKLVLQRDFAVILLDVYMPEMDGFETAALIRVRKRSSHTPIIFITSYYDEVRTAKGYAHGAVDYIPAPVEPEILRAKVRVFAELFRMRRQIARQAEERAQRLAAEEAARQSAFLARASSVLSSSLDSDTLLPGLARLAVPFLADLAVVCRADDAGCPGRTEWAWVAPDAEEASQARGLPLPTWIADALDRGFRAGMLEFMARIDPPAPSRAGNPSPERDGAHQPESPDFPVSSAMILPLVARGRTLGAVALGLGPSGRRYGPEDAPLAEDLVGRAAIALDNALLHRQILDADHRKTEFLSMLAHELRNPLAPIRNGVQVLRMLDLNEPLVIQVGEMIDRQTAHMARLVDDLLDISRITSGKIRLQPVPIDASTVVNSALEISRPLLESRRHQCILSLPQQDLRVNADPDRLAQVLANLLNNAAKYTKEDGRIWLSVDREGDEAVFRVRDTGIGIPAEMLSKVFDLFTQVDRSLDRSQGGLGIGLTLVRRLVEMHGGRVQATSAGPGLGSEFVVRLPAIPVEHPAHPADNGTTVERRAPASCRVLVVDDNVDAAESLAMLLRFNGHEVRLAFDGPGALDAAVAFLPELVLLDIGLPGMDGFEVARRLRTGSNAREVLLVAMTGYSQEEYQRKSREAGFDYHLVKPVDPRVLEELLAQIGASHA
jgi:signal transduction histidine kinase